MYTKVFNKNRHSFVKQALGLNVLELVGWSFMEENTQQ